MLSGLRVVELSDPNGWLAGRMLADLGADVTLITDEQLRETHPYEWAAFNAGKHLAEYDESLLRDADVVIETGVTPRYEELGSPTVVWCVLTSFGRTGPRAAQRASDLSVQAQSGVMYMTGDPDRAPVASSAPTSWHHGCADAVAGIMVALLQREKTGRGQLVDVSMQEAHLMAAMSRVGQLSLAKSRGKRAGALMRVGETVQREIWPCKDGHVSFGLRGGPARIPGLKRLVAWMDEEGLATAAGRARRDQRAGVRGGRGRPACDQIPCRSRRDRRARRVARAPGLLAPLRNHRNAEVIGRLSDVRGVQLQQARDHAEHEASGCARD